MIWVALSLQLLFSSSALATADINQMMGAMNQAQQLKAIGDSRLVRPTPHERQAIQSLLHMKPRPKTLNDADIKFLKDLLNKAAWFGAEGRIMHEIWTEVTGKEWSSPNQEDDDISTDKK